MTGTINIAQSSASEAGGVLIEQINELRKKQDAVILAHNYQIPPIQDLADFVGDSLALARQAAKTEASVIVLCGVYFMAETAKLLNPSRTVLIPDAAAGCSLADSITADDLRAWKAEHPGAVVVSYVNTSAAVKAETDICCTSGNAVAVIRSIPEDKEILFLPDMFLGDYLRRITGRKMHIWAGECHVHAGIRPSEVKDRMKERGGADLLIHPECGCTTSLVWAKSQDNLLPENTFMLSTDGMLRHAAKSPNMEFVVATETGLLHRLEKQYPDKTFLPADAGAVCPYMKMITLPKLRDALRDLQPEVIIPDDIAEKARLSIERMVAIS